MRSTIIVSAFAALALAAPRPQQIEFDQVDAAEDPVLVSAPSDVSFDIVDVLSVDAAKAQAAASVTDVASTVEKRDMLFKRDGDCKPEPAGTGPRVSK